MPQMLAPRRESFRRSGASLNGSKASLSSFGSSSRRPSATASGNSSFASQFSLGRRSSLLGSASRSSIRLLKEGDDSHPSAKRNAVWNVETKTISGRQNAAWDFGPGAVASTGPPSLTSSITSASTSTVTSSSTERSSQSSLHQPPSPGNDALQRFYALNKASLQTQRANVQLRAVPTPVGSTARNYDLRRPSRPSPQPRPVGGGLSSLCPRRHSFVPSAPRIKEEDAAHEWGHFVETADALEDLTRRSRVLSARNSGHRHASRSFGQLCMTHLK